MGNQGTKDWKLTAFFAIGLMLIAGLFGNAAIAADGDGSVIDVTGWWGIILTKSPTITLFLPAGSEGNMDADLPTLQLDVNMNGGSVRIAIPNGWKVPAAGVQVLEDAAAADKRLFLVGTPLAGIGGYPDGGSQRRGLLLGMSNLPLDRLLSL